ncbi:hypothetical protein V6Z12_D11G155100 [Gossypium hirsutum]
MVYCYKYHKSTQFSKFLFSAVQKICFQIFFFSNKKLIPKSNPIAPVFNSHRRVNFISELGLGSKRKESSAFATNDRRPDIFSTGIHGSTPDIGMAKQYIDVETNSLGISKSQLLLLFYINHRMLNFTMYVFYYDKNCFWPPL